MHLPWQDARALATQKEVVEREVKSMEASDPSSCASIMLV